LSLSQIFSCPITPQLYISDKNVPVPLYLSQILSCPNPSTAPPSQLSLQGAETNQQGNMIIPLLISLFKIYHLKLV
jgi:hypothetical protein